MYSALQPVRGHDRTCIPRVSAAQYAAALAAPRAQKRDPLRSSDPTVKFVLRFPLFDAYGREVCVIHQIHEFEWQAELRRLASGGDVARRSGVRLSEEISIDSAGAEHGTRSGGGFDDVEVSAITVSDGAHHGEAAAGPIAPPRGLVPLPRSDDAALPSRNPSEFLIARDSSLNPLTRLPEPRHHHHRKSLEPYPAGPVAVAPGAPSADEAGHNGNEAAATNTGGARHASSCVPAPRAFHAAGELFAPETRGSNVRATKQLFGSDRAATTGRGTTRHAHLISNQAYGVHSTDVLEKAVALLIEQNFQSVSGVFAELLDLPLPTLHSGSVVSLAEKRYLVGRYFPAADVFQADELDAFDQPILPLLLYRWKRSRLPANGNEARRAAHGLSVCAPTISVLGFTFRDGGITILGSGGASMVPLSSLPCEGALFPVVLKVLLRLLSEMVAKRVIHGNLHALSDVFVGLASDGQLIVAPVHWERIVDFSMFLDRNVGRSILLQRTGGASTPVGHSQDVATIIEACCANEKLAENLTDQQRTLLHQLLALTTQQTQVANYIVQLKNTMASIPADLAALCTVLQNLQRLQ